MKIMKDKTYHLLVNLTWKCGYKCNYCWTVILGRDEGTERLNLPDEPCDKWVTAINNLPPSVIDWCGGEPLSLYPDFINLCRETDDKHDQAVSTNLQNEKKVIEFTKYVPTSKFISITCSWHKYGTISKEEFAIRALILQKAGFKIQVNIVDSNYYIKDLLIYKKYFESQNLHVNVSPFENPNLIGKTDFLLKCNAGVNTFMVNNNGDVYRCLTGFRSPYNLDVLLGNLIDGSFKPYDHELNCILKCDIYYILDRNHTQKHMFSTHVSPAKIIDRIRSKL
jgi:sulfatase maturation enzyme AslB (radical SAM superfamily)